MTTFDFTVSRTDSRLRRGAIRRVARPQEPWRHLVRSRARHRESRGRRPLLSCREIRRPAVASLRPFHSSGSGTQDRAHLDVGRDAWARDGRDDHIHTRPGWHGSEASPRECAGRRDGTRAQRRMGVVHWRRWRSGLKRCPHGKTLLHRRRAVVHTGHHACCTTGTPAASIRCHSPGGAPPRRHAGVSSGESTSGRPGGVRPRGHWTFDAASRSDRRAHGRSHVMGRVIGPRRVRLEGRGRRRLECRGRTIFRAIDRVGSMRFLPTAHSRARLKS